MEEDRLETILNHIKTVQDNCLKLGEALIKADEEDMGRQLIANSMLHDNSKFYGIEWKYLNPETKELKPELFKAAHEQHVTTNKHHPESWSSIQLMPPVYLAELSCDWLTRSSEFGTSVWEYLKGRGPETYGFSTSSRVYKDIKRYLEMILEPTFK